MDRARPPATLVEDLSTVVDDMRQLEVELGARPWRVFVVLYKWSGREVGDGTPHRESVLELTPAPIVKGEGGLREQRTRGGTSSEGVVRLVEVSPRYTEGDLDVLMRTLATAEEIFIEVIHDGRDGKAPERRAYKPSSKPERDPLGFGWSLSLQKINTDRVPDTGARTEWSHE